MATTDDGGDMTTALEGYTPLADRFGAVVDALRPHDWDAPSPCEGWTGRDVLEHVVSTQCDFLGGHGIDVGGVDDAAMSLRADPARAWHEHDHRMRAVLGDRAVAEKEYDGVFGRSTIGEAVTRFYGFDLIVHRWDLATTGGRDEPLSGEELDAVAAAADGFGEHLYGEGVCKPAVEVGEDASPQERVLARLGRRA